MDNDAEPQFVSSCYRRRGEVSSLGSQLRISMHFLSRVFFGGENGGNYLNTLPQLSQQFITCNWQRERWIDILLIDGITSVVASLR